MTQQTAVEWLIKQINGQGFNKVIIDIPKEMIEQAKAIEKEQIIDAYWNGTTDMEKQDAMLMAEDFFNDYYKK